MFVFGLGLCLISNASQWELIGSFLSAAVRPNLRRLRGCRHWPFSIHVSIFVLEPISHFLFLENSFLDRSVLNLLSVMHILNFSQYQFVHSGQFLFDFNVVSCSRSVADSVHLFSADFCSPSIWPLLSPLPYPLIMGSSLKATVLGTSDSPSILCMRRNGFSLCFYARFTLSIESGVSIHMLIFQCFNIAFDHSTYYLSHSLMISYCLLAFSGLHRLGIYKEIRLASFLLWVYPGDSCLSNFSGYASFFCIAE